MRLKRGFFLHSIFPTTQNFFLAGRLFQKRVFSIKLSFCATQNFFRVHQERHTFLSVSPRPVREKSVWYIFALIHFSQNLTYVSSNSHSIVTNNLTNCMSILLSTESPLNRHLEAVYRHLLLINTYILPIEGSV